MSDRNISLGDISCVPLRTKEGMMGYQLIVLFRTERFGLYQVESTVDGIEELQNEPSLEMFTKEQQQYMELVSLICYRMVNNYVSTKYLFDDRMEER